MIDDVVVETVWPKLKFANNLAISLLVISDAILFKPKHLKRIYIIFYNLNKIKLK